MRSKLIIALLLSTAPAHAITIAPWQLLESHFFQWDDWRDVFQFGPCNKIIPYRMANAPPVSAPPYVAPPINYVPPPDNPPPYVPPPYVPPPYTPPPPPVVDTPEASTWLMMLIGFAGLAGAYWRRARA